MEPTGLLELALTIAFCSSCMVSPRTASWSRSARTRTAYFCVPKISTWATPGRVEIRGRIARLAKASTSESRTWRRLQREEHHRPVGRIDLAEAGRRRSAPAAAGAWPRRSPTARRAPAPSMRPVEVELQDDRGVAERRRRRHRCHAGDGRELALQDGRDRGGHGLGAGAGKLGGDLDGREVDARDGGDGQAACRRRGRRGRRSPSAGWS